VELFRKEKKKRKVENSRECESAKHLAVGNKVTTEIHHHL
jgi:hypothetical protein